MNTGVPAPSRTAATHEGDWDVVVVGAGPAGAVSALELARAGGRVLLVDRATFPRAKVCGCCLNMRAMATLDDLGLGESIGALGPRALSRFRLAAAGAQATVRLPGGMSLSRESLDKALVDAAEAAGAMFMPGRRAWLCQLDHSDGFLALELAGAADDVPAVVRARVVVAADGLGGSFAAERLGGERFGRVGRIGAGVALEAGVAVDWDDDAVNMAVGREGYVGMVRLEDGRWNLAAALDPEATRSRGHIAPVVAALLAGAGWRVPRALLDAPWRGTPRLWRRPLRVAAERLFAVGDAGGYVEPFTGEGMAWALAAGRAVAPLAMRAARRWEPGLAGEWARTLREDVQRGQMVSRIAASALGHPGLIRVLMGALAAWPALAEHVVGRLNAGVSRRAERDVA